MATASTTSTTTAQKPTFNLDTFLRLTSPQIQPMNPNQAWADGVTQTWNLPQAGLASMMMLYVDAEITVAGTVTSGKFNDSPYPAPFSLLKNISLSSNQNINLHNYSGWGLYKWLRTRYGTDIFATASKGAFHSSVTEGDLGLGNGINPIVPGANVAAGTYSIRLALPIPIAYNSELLTGMLFLQNNSVLYQLGVQYGNIIGGISATGGSNDIFNTLVGTGLSVTATVSTQVEIETMIIPKNYPPDTSMFMSISETNFPLVAGQNAFRPPVNDIYTMLITEVIANYSPVDIANISNITFTYSNNLRRAQEYGINKAAWNFWKSGIVPPNGCFIYDFGMRKGLPNKRDVYDAFNYSKVTDLQIGFTLPTTIVPSTGSQISFLSESLRFIKQA